MQLHKSYLLALTGVLVLPLCSSAKPIDYNEVSLLVRARESEPAIIREVSQRRMLRKLTPEQEATLRAQGAAESLVNRLRDSALVLSQNDLASYEANRDRSATPRASSHQGTATGGDLALVDVGYGHPINLSFWGGPDQEFVFSPTDRFERGTAKVEMIDPVGTYTHVQTYLGVSTPDWYAGEREYTSATAHEFRRPIPVDFSNPLRVAGHPLLYPVYAARGVALYYIGAASADSVRVAVSVRR